MRAEAAMSDPAILVVDDNPDHLELILMALADCCAPERVATASEGALALDYLFGRGLHAGRDTAQQPRLVILDLKLVRLSGLEVLRAIRSDPRTGSLPVVMHSSSVEDRDVAECYASGANGYVRKATDYDELRSRMRHLYEFWVLGKRRDIPAGDRRDA